MQESKTEQQLANEPAEPALRIAVVVPCYRETAHILPTLAAMPDLVTDIVVVDDACPDQTGQFVRDGCTDPRVTVLVNAENQGVGGATVAGFKWAVEAGIDIVVKVDGDGQMDPADIPRLIRPLLAGAADYTKGNRFFRLSDVRAMPAVRVFGNAVLSFLSKLSSGYWRIFDPTNGFVAIHGNILAAMPLDHLQKGYFFESDLLYQLSILRAVVQDVPQRAHYGDEVSHFRPARDVPLLLGGHCRNFFRRIFYTYFLRDFHVASLQWLLGPIFFLFGLFFGVFSWLDAIDTRQEATAGTVMLSALPFIVGLQLLLSALGFDMDNQPRDVVHKQL